MASSKPRAQLPGRSRLGFTRRSAARPGVGTRRGSIATLGAAIRALLLSWCCIASATASAEVTLNLQDADIKALIDTVAEATGKNFVVDPRVAGKVTVISKRPMDEGEIYQVFLSILEVHGFSAIPSGDIIKVVPDVKAKQAGIVPAKAAQGASGDEIVTRVIRVENVNAAQLVPILRPLVPQQGHLAAHPDTNVLVVSDRASNVVRLARIVARIDRTSEGEIDVVPLQHASATEIVRVLGDLQQPAGKGAAQAPSNRVVADERTNSVLISGERSERLRMRALVSHLDTPLEESGNTHVVFLRYAKAEDLVPVLTGISETIDKKREEQKARRPETPVSVQADETSNSLVITAPQDVFRNLRSVVKQLDVRRAQVLVEAVIAEVTLDKSRELGVQWVVDGTPDGSGPVGVINFGGPGTSISDIATGIETGQIQLPDGALLGLGRFDSSSVNFAALVRALSNDATTNVLSTPSLVTLDNQEAEIVVGQNVPFVTGEFTTTGTATGTVNPFRTIQRQDVGLTLRVQPQINEGDAVKLEIEQEVSSLSPSAVSASDLITNKRTLKTTVMVEDGQTIVLGGLIDDTVQQTRQKVPLLGDVPVLGPLFRFNRTSDVKRNLMVFLRPAIIRDAAMQAQVTSGKYSYMRAQQMKLGSREASVLGGESSPLFDDAFIELPPPFDEPADSNP